jgi:hypothetical protein
LVKEFEKFDQDAKCFKKFSSKNKFNNQEYTVDIGYE